MSDISIKDFHSSPVVSVKLDISESTLRKYSQILEKSGWRFTKNERKARVFSDQDLDVLKTFIKIKDELGMSLEKSSDMSVRYYRDNDTLTYQESSSIDRALSEKRQNNVLQEMRHTEEKLLSKIEKIYEDNDIVINKINQVLDENESLKNDNKELKKQLHQILENQNKSFFSKIFNR